MTQDPLKSHISSTSNQDLNAKSCETSKEYVKNKNVKFIPDILTIFLVLVFVVNLGLYLKCQSDNLAHISKRDRQHTRSNRSSSSKKGIRSAKDTERERLERGEKEQELHAPNRSKPAESSNGDDNNAEEYVSSDDDMDINPAPGEEDLDAPEDGVFDHHVLATMLNSDIGRKLLEEMVNMKGALRLTPEQQNILLNTGNNHRETNLAIHNIVDILRTSQIKFLLQKREEIENASIHPGSLKSLADSTCERLSRIKVSPIVKKEEELNDKGAWSPRSIVTGISMLYESPDEECRIDSNQAESLIKAIKELERADADMQKKNEESMRLEDILNDEQMDYLFENLKDKV